MQAPKNVNVSFDNSFHLRRVQSPTLVKTGHVGFDGQGRLLVLKMGAAAAAVSQPAKRASGLGRDARHR